jgi:hypothetical protein
MKLENLLAAQMSELQGRLGVEHFSADLCEDEPRSALQIIDRLSASIRCRPDRGAAGFPPYRE